MAQKKNLDAAGRRIKTPGEAPLARLAEKDITETSADIVAYIKEQTGYDADPRSVQLGSILRGRFQSSPGNQAKLLAKRAEVEQRAADRKARLAGEKSAPKAKVNVAPKAAPAPAPKAAPKAAKPAATATIKRPAAPAKKEAVATVKRRRPASQDF